MTQARSSGNHKEQIKNNLDTFLSELVESMFQKNLSLKTMKKKLLHSSFSCAAGDLLVGNQPVIY